MKLMKVSTWLATAFGGVAVLMGVAPSASAAVIPIVATLDPFQEVGMGAPVVGSSGMGSLTGTYDTDSQEFEFSVTFSGLLGTTIPIPPPPMAGGNPAHIHVAPPGANGGILFHITGIPVGVTAATSPVQNRTLSDGEEAQLLGGLWYVNVHTTARPGGEIRGQLMAIPEPGSVMLMLGGLAGLIVVRRRRTV